MKFEDYMSNRVPAKAKTEKEKFLEYLNSQKKLVEKPKTEKVADFHDKSPKAPVKAKGMKEAPAPYDASKVNVKPTKKSYPSKNHADGKSEAGFADMGVKSTVYEPDVDAKPSLVKNGGVLEAFTCAKTVSIILKENKQTAEFFLNNLKKNGSLDILIDAMLDRNEIYESISDKLSYEDGIKYARKLTRAMNEVAQQVKEEVGPPVHQKMEKDLEDDSEEESDDEEFDDEESDEDEDSEDSEDSEEESDEDEMGDEGENGMSDIPAQRMDPQQNMMKAMNFKR